MFSTIVVGHGGTARAADAVALALQLRDLPTGRLVLTAVTPRHGHDDPRPLERLQAAAEALPGGAPVELEVIEARSVADGLNLVAAAREADLIVLGSTHRAAPARAAGRATMQRLLHGAPCAVAAAAPEQWARVERPRLLVAYDASPESDAALEAAYAIAAPRSGSVRLVQVVDPIAGVPSATAASIALAAIARRDFSIGQALRSAAARAPEGVEVEFRVLRSSTPSRRIIDEAHDGAFDLAVCGSRHHGRVRRALEGSISGALLLQGRLAVLAVPGPDVTARGFAPDSTTTTRSSR